jgi:hypothetical protein
VGVFLVVLGVDLASPSAMTADSIRAVSVAAAMVHFHTISLDRFRPLPAPGYAITASHGHLYPFFPWAVSLFAVPWVVALDLLQKIGIGHGSLQLIRSGKDWQLQVVSMSVVVAGAAVVVYFIAVRAFRMLPLRRRMRWAGAGALAFAFATPAWSTASRSMWQHGPSMLFLALAILLALRADEGRSGWAGMGACLAAAYTMRPTNATPVLVLSLWALLAHRRHFLSYLAGAAPVAAVFLSVNLVAYHALLPAYYTHGQGFAITHTVLVALLGDLVSPSRGLLFFVPLVVLSVAGVWLQVRHGWRSSLWQAFAIIPVAHWVLISTFKHWWGGDSYGPRFFTDMMPFFFVLALPAVDHLATVEFGAKKWAAGATVVLLVWSVGVHAQGAVLRSAWCWNNEPVDVDTRPSHVWAWSDPQFLRGARRLIFGPDRSSEVRRGGVAVIGCPREPVRP